MTRARWSAGFLLVGVGATVSLAPGCGGSDLECGTYAVERDGKCVPKVGGCAEGTFSKNGQCVPQCSTSQRWDGTACVAIPKCGAGTQESAGKCVPKCASNAAWDGTACVPLTTCAEGLVANPQTGACEPAEGLCSTGSSWKDGACVPDLVCSTGTHAETGTCVSDTVPPADVTESPEADGAADFTLPAGEQSTVLGGVVDEPAGFSFPDWDRFRFTAEAGTWLELDAVSAGALRPAFVVQSEEVGKDGTPRFIRYALDDGGMHTRREVYLPVKGTYEIRLTDHTHLLASIFDGVKSLPVGGADFGYSIVVKNLGTPVPEAVDSLPAKKTGELSDGTLHFYSVKGLATGDFVGVSSAGLPPPTTESDAFRAVMAFGPSGAFLGQNVAFQTYVDAELPFEAYEPGDHLVVQDYLLTLGTRDDFELQLFALQETKCTASSCASGSIPENGNQLLRWDLAEGDFLVAGVYLPGNAQQYVKVSFYDDNLQPAVADSAASPADVGVGYLYASAPTTARMWLREWDGAAVSSYSVDARVIATPAFTTGNTYTHQTVHDLPPYTLKPAGIGHFKAKAGQVVFFTGFETYPAGAWQAPQEMMMTPRLDKMGPIIDTDAWNFPDGFVTPLFSYVKQDGHYLHWVFDGGQGPDNAAYDTKMTVQDTFKLGSPAVGTPAQASGHNLSKGMALYTFEGKKNQYYEIKVSPKMLSNMIPDLWVFNFGRAEFAYVSYEWVGDMLSDQLGLIERKTATTNDPVSIGYTSPYDGTTMLLVQTSSGSGTVLHSFDLSVTAPAAPGNDTCQKAGAVQLDSSGHAAFTFSSAAATNDVANSGCTDYATSGPDVFFSVPLKEGDTLDVTMKSEEFSAALYLFTDCADTKTTCVAGSEYGTPRKVTYTVPPGKAGTYLIAADSHNLGGSFDMDVQVTGN